MTDPTPELANEKRVSSGPDAFTTLMVHLYRGEIARSNTWRTRLDSTTNWAVLTTAAVLTFSFSAASRPHVVILIALVLLWLFLVIEARRYRYYELSALRLRLIETEFFASAMTPPQESHRDWASGLVGSLLNPEFPISFWEAIGRRLRRNYISIFSILGGAWMLKLMPFAGAGDWWSLFEEAAAIGTIPGRVVVLCVGAFYAGIFLLAIMTYGLRSSPGEVLSHHELLEYPGGLISHLVKAASQVVRRHEQLAIIVTAKPEEVSQHLLSVLKRGVTGVQGKGLYTGEVRHILFCAVKPSEVARLHSVVYAADPKAFVVVNPTQSVWGGGFMDLAPRWLRRSREKENKPTGGKSSQGSSSSINRTS